MNDVSSAGACLWLLDGSQVHGDEIASYAGQNLSASETARLYRFARSERRWQFLLGRMLLRYAGAALAGRFPSDLQVSERPGSSPQLILPSHGHLVRHFSLSHSRQWIACVTSPQAILGLDIEVNDASRDIIGIGEMVFTPREYSWLLSRPDAEKVAAFYYLWSAREARYKLQCNLGRNRFSAPIVGDEGAPPNQGNCWYRCRLPGANITVVLCSDRRLLTVRQKIVNGFPDADWRPTNQRSHVG